MSARVYDHQQKLWGVGREAAVGSPHGRSAGVSPASLPTLGLSQAHKWPQQERKVGSFVITTAAGGSYCEIRQVGEARPGREGQGIRGSVKGFSRSSRLNCIKCINQIDRRQVLATWFLTLTVPRDEVDWKGIERHRKAWEKRLRRRWPGRWFAFWKKEAHKSGTPHLHVLLFWLEAPPDLEEFKSWNDDAWADVVKSENPHHRRVGCRVEVMRGWNGVKSYTAKYLTKDQDGLLGETGRIWGISRRELMPRQLTESEADADVGHRVKRALRKHQERKREAWYVWVDGGWRRIRPSKLAGAVIDQVQHLRFFGARLKRRRPKLCHTISVPIWIEETTDRGNGKSVTQVVREGDELHSFGPSIHFIDAGTITRLVEFFEGRCAADRRAVADIPF